MYSKKQRIAAIIGIVLLVLLYIVTLIAAIFNFDGSGRLFQACLFATIGVPLLLWIYIWLYGKVKGKETIATVFPVQSKDTDAENPDSENPDTH